MSAGALEMDELLDQVLEERARRRAPRIARARRDRHRYCGADRANGRRAAGAFSTALIGDAASRMLLGGPVWSSPAHDLQLGGPGAKPTECKKYFPSVGETLRWVSSRRCHTCSSELGGPRQWQQRRRQCRWPASSPTATFSMTS